MKINALRLYNVKRFGGRGIAIEGIGDGVNVLCAANEHGKSTCFEALHALFFQPHSGTPQGVQQLRPYSGGNPLVEADIATAQGRYRLAKQFYGGRRASVTDLDSGRLLAQADEAEGFIADLIRGGTAGPAGLLWVRQGVTGIEKRSRAEEEGEKRVRAGLLSSVQGEVEALTGGRRMAEIADACDDELARLVTATMKARTGGPYDAALEDQKRLAAEEMRLRLEVNAMRDALDRRLAAQKRLAEIDDAQEAAARRDAIATAETALDAAKLHASALKFAEAEAALARNRRDKAQAELEAFVQASDMAATLEQKSAPARLRRDEAAARRADAILEIDKAREEIETAEAEEREARHLLVRLDAALAARAASERLVESRRRLEQADAARIKMEQSEAEEALLSVSAKSVEQLQALEITIVGLRAQQAATLPTFQMAYDDGRAGMVSVGSEAVPDFVDQVFAGVTRLEIAGIGTLTLRSNRPQSADRALEEADEKRLALLVALGVDSLAAARIRQSLAQAKSAELALARQRLADLAPEGLASLRAEAARLADLGKGELEPFADAHETRRRLAATQEKVTQSRNGARELQPSRSRADDAVVAAQTALAALASEMAGLDPILGPVFERDARRALLEAERASQQALFEAAEARALPLRTASHDLAAAEAALTRTRSVEQAAGQECAALRVTLADLSGQIRTRSDDAVEEAWREASDALVAAKGRVRSFEKEIAVLDRLKRALVTSRSSARDLYLKPVMSELRPLLGLLFDDISIEFDEETLLPQTIRRNGQNEDVDRLSGGMREQLSVLTRLAFARLLARNGRPAPVILDDALVYSDDDRIERMFDALHSQARDQQILVFSCRQRAFAKLGGNVLRTVDWRPELS